MVYVCDNLLSALARMVYNSSRCTEHVKFNSSPASTRGNTVIDFRFVDRGYTALEAESALVQHSTCSWLDLTLLTTNVPPSGVMINP